ncbi:MAG: AraC family transcriptional regulator [Lachnospiraceae bacterium]|nr:AraC family transcriptional regulator [Lachnospiraceae bacterium]
MGNTRHCIEDNPITCFDGVKLLYVSTSKYEGDWQSILHSHTFSELFYVVRGSGSFITEGMEFPVCSNDMVVINPNVQHTEKSLRTAPLEYIVLGIEGLSFSFENIAAAQEGVYMQTAFGDVYKYNTQRSNIYAYLNIMLEEIDKKQGNYESVCQKLLDVILLCMLRNNHLSIVQGSNAFANRECIRIKNYLEANYAENITLDTLASLSHMNKYYMVHAFTRYVGVSPITYLLQKRIQEGKSLLESTTYSIAQISTTLGFSSQSYFSQAFKKSTGKTPNQYRSEYKLSQ